MTTPQHSCQWVIVSPDPEDEKYVIETVCGAPADTLVTVKSRVTHARVWLCHEHKQEHDIAFTLIRVQQRNSRNR